jgi:hypothetical protein
MFKPPFKFLDSYTKDDREIFFGRDRDTIGLRIYPEYIIPPLQGLMGFCLQYRIGRCQMLRYFALTARYKSINCMFNSI